MTGSVIPCHRGAKCSWPACELGCDGRPGLEHATLPQKLAELRAYFEGRKAHFYTYGTIETDKALALLAIVEAAQEMRKALRNDLAADELGNCRERRARRDALLGAINAYDAVFSNLARNP